MYGCESWIIKRAECWKIDAFELWSWRRLSRVPWTARRSNQSILKDINAEYSLEGLVLKLKLQYLGHLMWRAYSLEKTWCWERLKTKGERDSWGWDGQIVPPGQLTWITANFRNSLVAQKVKSLPAMQENQVRSLGWEDPLEKEMTTHSSILAWEIPWTEEPDRLQFVGLQRVRQHDLVTEQQVPPHCLTFSKHPIYTQTFILPNEL